MIARLLSGAGAVADVADRIVRAFVKTGNFGAFIVAFALAAAAVASLIWGIEATDNPDPRTLEAGSVANTAEFGNRTYSTITGDLQRPYIETFEDRNGNDKQDPDEEGRNWFYWLVDKDTHVGLTVRSSRSPDEVFRMEVTGRVHLDEEYVAEDRRILQARIDEFGVQVDPRLVIEVTAPSDVPSADFDWSSTPAQDAVVKVAGTNLDYVSVCGADPNGDGQCTADEIDGWDVLLFEPTSKRGIVVFTELPQAPLISTFTGMLRRDPQDVETAKNPDESSFEFSDLGITVSDQYVLEDRATPASAPLAFASAAVLGVLAAIVLIGRVAGFVVYRPKPLALPSRRRTLEPDERIPVRVSGNVLTPQGVIRVREAPMDLVRLALSPAEPAAAEATDETTASDATDETTPLEAVPTPTSIFVESPNRTTGLGIGGGYVTSLSVGEAVPFRGPRPAVRMVTNIGTLSLSFKSTAERDRAVAELLEENDLVPGLSGEPGTAGRRIVS